MGVSTEAQLCCWFLVRRQTRSRCEPQMCAGTHYRLWKAARLDERLILSRSLNFTQMQWGWGIFFFLSFLSVRLSPRLDCETVLFAALTE